MTSDGSATNGSADRSYFYRTLDGWPVELKISELNYP
jgi:hypothetical protein